LLATVGFFTFATGGFCRHVIVQERRRRAKRQRKEALETWEGEGGAIAAPVKPADAHVDETAATV
jgi:hypothetical protein